MKSTLALGAAMTCLHFDGETIEPQDDRRLTPQFFRVRDLMLDGAWRTLADISTILGYPEASVSARLRDLRKEKFGGFVVERKRVNGSGLFTYRVRVGADWFGVEEGRA